MPPFSVKASLSVVTCAMRANGVTAVVPLALLAQLRPDGFDWQVPGMRDELITALLRALPKAIRRHVVNDAPGFAKMLKNKHLRATYGDLRHDEGKLQRPPKGFDPDHPLIDYLKLKSFFVWIEVDLALNEPDKLVPQLASGFKDAFALVTWLRGVPENIEE